MKCSCCGHDVTTNGVCQVQGCTNEAKYEGYSENRDFSGNTTGSMILIKVCSNHKAALIGGR